MANASSSVPTSTPNTHASHNDIREETSTVSVESDPLRQALELCVDVCPTVLLYAVLFLSDCSSTSWPTRAALRVCTTGLNFFWGEAKFLRKFSKFLLPTMSELSAYELERLQNIERNNEKLIELGLASKKKEKKKKKKRRRPTEPTEPTEPPEPTRRSRRITPTVRPDSPIRLPSSLPDFVPADVMETPPPYHPALCQSSTVTMDWCAPADLVHAKIRGCLCSCGSEILINGFTCKNLVQLASSFNNAVVQYLSFCNVTISDKRDVIRLFKLLHDENMDEVAQDPLFTHFCKSVGEEEKTVALTFWMVFHKSFIYCIANFMQESLRDHKKCDGNKTSLLRLLQDTGSDYASLLKVTCKIILCVNDKERHYFENVFDVLDYMWDDVDLSSDTFQLQPHVKLFRYMINANYYVVKHLETFRGSLSQADVKRNVMLYLMYHLEFLSKFRSPIEAYLSFEQSTKANTALPALLRFLSRFLSANGGAQRKEAPLPTL